MWTSKIDTIEEGRSLKITISKQSTILRYAEVLKLWQKDEGFRDFFIDLISNLPFKGFFWETPPVTASDAGKKPFEFVVINSGILANAKPNQAAFNTYFARATEDGIVTFTNIGNDATLVVPCPVDDPVKYTHIAAFIRTAPQEQKHALLKNIGEAVESQLSNSPLWVNTAGLGIYWLHIRIDSRPKYYRHMPYKY